MPSRRTTQKVLKIRDFQIRPIGQSPPGRAKDARIEARYWMKRKSGSVDAGDESFGRTAIAPVFFAERMP